VSPLIELAADVGRWAFGRVVRRVARRESPAGELEELQDSVTRGDQLTLNAIFTRWRNRRRLADRDRPSGGGGDPGRVQPGPAEDDRRPG